jgi:hypothetical protein
MRKGKDPVPDPDPYLLLMDPYPGGPKTWGSGSPTLVLRLGVGSTTMFSYAGSNSNFFNNAELKIKSLLKEYHIVNGISTLRGQIFFL